MPLKRVSSSVVHSKQCTKCFKTKPMAEFGINRRIEWDGRQPMCRECRNQAQRAYRASLKTPDQGTK